ncbi:glycosyltransferase family 4 protein [Demequina sp. NBRC 110053]|uniref:glycosyltransferase family 4 protein n=1 Tax=Demequina sp. NBRC 110053 TaxID=1570342 RepID=UPI001185B7CC|nr:glycosyltransferase family 4 protein [Demequina sp. NBRC 110053]
MLTPGDHYSPRTGSAIPTVVHGIAQAASGDTDWRHGVAIDRTTFQPRYRDAVAWECEPSSPPGRVSALADYARGAIGRRRHAEDAWWHPVAARAAAEAPHAVLAHGAPSLAGHPALHDTPVFPYLHNALPASMTRSEAARALGPAVGIVCVSEALASTTAARLPHHLRARVHAIGHGVDTVAFHPRDAREPGPVQVMFVGRTVPHKGVHVLLEAAAALAGLPVEITVVGSHGFSASDPLTRYQRRLRRLAARAPIPVHFVPFVDRHALPEMLRRADVLAVPSTWAEPSGLTAGEGLATGLAVVASRVGGLPEVVGDAGVLARAGDARAWGDALRWLVSDEHARADLGRAARRRAEAHDWSRTWRALREVVDHC